MLPKVCLVQTPQTFALIQSLYTLQEKYFQLLNAHHSQDIDPTANLHIDKTNKKQNKNKKRIYLRQLGKPSCTHASHTPPQQTLPIQTTKT